MGNSLNVLANNGIISLRINEIAVGRTASAIAGMASLKVNDYFCDIFEISSK